jgi:N-methylhydantoinase A
LTAEAAAFGVVEVVDENMANAARVHAVENGKEIADHVMIAFGGAAPLHAARLCEKLGVDLCLVPEGAGVGSAIGFLKAPFAYEAVASRLMRLSAFDAAAANALIDELRASAEAFVRSGADGPLSSEATAFMRYVGQGWEIPVRLEPRAFAVGDGAALREAFQATYARFFGRAIDALGDLEIEIVTWSVKVSDARIRPERHELRREGVPAPEAPRRPVFDPGRGAALPTAIYERSSLQPGAWVSGPAIIVERETSTVVTASFDAVRQSDGSLLLLRKGVRSGARSTPSACR